MSRKATIEQEQAEQADRTRRATEAARSGTRSAAETSEETGDDGTGGPLPVPERHRLPDTRPSMATKVELQGHDIYVPARPGVTVKIGVVPTPRQPGARALTDEVPHMEILPVEEVFETPFETDAHYTCYEVVGLRGETWPRLTKAVLPRIRAAEGDVVCHLLSLDFDNPGHAPWTDHESMRRARGAIRHHALAKDFPLADKWRWFYTTKSGFRLVYQLDVPAPPEDLEPRLRWMIQQFSTRGFDIDPSARDWTRLMRCPWVVRNGSATYIPSDNAVPPLFEARDESYTVSLDDFGVAGGSEQHGYAEIEPIDAQMPTAAHRRDILHEVSPQTGNPVQSEWYKQAKRRLKGRECFDSLFGTALLASPGARDETLHAYLGQAIGLLYYLDGTTPEHIMALFHEAVSRLEPDSDTPDWIATCWDKIRRLWAMEDAKERARQEEAEQWAREVEDTLESMIRGVREWCPDPDVHSEDPEVFMPAIQRRMIAQRAKNYYVMDEKGTYRADCLTESEVVPFVRSRKLDGIIETTRQTENGPVDVDRSSLFNRYCYPVREVVGVPQINGGHIVDDNVLQIPLYRRSERIPRVFSRDVDNWLRALFGDDYMLGCKWIAQSLAFDEGCICALSIEGDPGVGKKLLIQGLAECLETPYFATAQDIVGDYQYGLMKSPFLWVNEGWPSGRAVHPLDTFRQLTGGDPLVANAKWMAPVKVFNPARLIFTANNADVVGFLVSGRDLSVSDTAALKERLLHINVGDRAAVHLKAKGGLRHTAGWIAGDGGAASNHTVASHFLWMYENRAVYGPKCAEGRYLVKGENNDDLISEVRTSTSKGQVVVEAVVKLLNKVYQDPAGNRELLGITIEDGRLYVTTKQILEFYRNHFKDSTRGESLTAKSIGHVLRNLAEIDRVTAMELESRPAIGRTRWHQLNAEDIHAAAQRDGWNCVVLDKLIEERERRKEGEHIESPVEV